MHWQLPDITEPTLAEALDDPIVQQVMRSDGVTRSALLGLMDHARAGMRVAPPQEGDSGAARHH